MVLAQLLPQDLIVLRIHMFPDLRPVFDFSTRVTQSSMSWSSLFAIFSY